MSAEPVLVGRIGGPYGIKGWVRIHSFTEPAENIFRYAPWQLIDPAGRPRDAVAELVDCKPHGKGWIAQLAGVGDREAAEALKGCAIRVERGELPELDEGQFYWTDLEGLRVEDTNGLALGRIENLLETGSADVMVVVREAPAARRLIPFVYGETVKEVDLAGGLVRVDWATDDGDGD